MSGNTEEQCHRESWKQREAEISCLLDEAVRALGRAYNYAENPQDRYDINMTWTYIRKRQIAISETQLAASKENKL